MTYTKNDQDWQRGRSWLGGTVRLADGSPNRKFIRALDIRTGRTMQGNTMASSGVVPRLVAADEGAAPDLFGPTESREPDPA